MKKVFRLFISSTFDDFKLERAVLQRFVFPEIKRYLNEKEMSFIPIDLRWGVPTEAQEDQKTMEICLNEVNRSAEELHPDFLVMVGDRYGWVPLPEKIEENEFKEIEKFVSNKELLNKWYKLDKNQIPSSYILQPVYEIVDKPTQKERLDIWYKESEELRENIKSILDETNLTDEQKEKYYLSATHQEYLYYKDISKSKNINPGENIIGYIREITPSKFAKEELTKAKFFEDLNGKELENYNNFKKEVSDLPNCYTQKIKDEEILKKEKDSLTTILTEEDIANLKDFNELPEYLKNFANEIKDKIFARIEKELQKQEKSIDFQEYYKNQILKDSLINGELIGRSEDIRKIKELLNTNNKIIISAESGTGKSAVIAKLIDELQKEKVDLIYRFCGVGEIYTKEHLLKDIFFNEFEDLLDEKFKANLRNKLKIPIFEKYDLLKQINNEERKQLEEIKFKFLELTKDKLIILDAIDQLEDKEDEFDWLPENFIISVLNDKNYEEDSNPYKTLKIFPEIKEYKLKPIQNQEDIKKIILQKLKKRNRTLTDNQFEYVLSRKDSKKPLYLTIALQELKTWRDDENNSNYNPQKENSKAKLSNTQQSLIKEFIQNLYTIHRNDELLVKRTFGYIYASQNHLDEELLLEVLSNDEEIMDRVSNKWHLNITGKLPDAVWARLRGEIINFLKEDSKGNIQFFHREFKNASEKFYNQKIAERLINILETLPPTPKVLEAHANTLVLLKTDNKNYKINFEWFNNLNDELNQYYFRVFDNFIYTDENEIKEILGYVESFYEISKYLYEKNPEVWITNYVRVLEDLGHWYILMDTKIKIIDSIKDMQKEEFIKKAEMLYKQALAIIKEAYKKEPDRWFDNYLNVLDSLGRLYSKIGKIEKAEKLYEESFKIAKEIYEKNNDWKKHYLFILHKLGDWYSDVKNPKTIEDFIKIENSEKAEKFYKEELKILKEAYEKDPEEWIEYYSKALNDLGEFYIKINNYEEAIDIFKTIIKLLNNKKNYNLSKLYENAKNKLIYLESIYQNKVKIPQDIMLDIQQFHKKIENLDTCSEKEELELRKNFFEKLKEYYIKYPNEFRKQYLENLLRLMILENNFDKEKLYEIESLLRQVKNEDYKNFVYANLALFYFLEKNEKYRKFINKIYLNEYSDFFDVILGIEGYVLKKIDKLEKAFKNLEKIMNNEMCFYYVLIGYELYMLNKDKIILEKIYEILKNKKLISLLKTIRRNIEKELGITFFQKFITKLKFKG